MLGVIWKPTDKLLLEHTSRTPADRYADDDSMGDEEEEAIETTKIVEQVSTFHDMLIWGHDQSPSDTDVFVKGVEEWIRFAEAIHGSNTADEAYIPS